MPSSTMELSQQGTQRGRRATYIIFGVALLAGSICGILILPYFNIKLPALTSPALNLIPDTVTDELPIKKHCIFLVDQYRGRARIQIRLASGFVEERVVFDNQQILDRLRVVTVQRSRLTVVDPVTKQRWNIDEGESLLLKEE